MARKKLKTVPEFHTRCPFCGHDMKRSTWSIAHTNLDQITKCEKCERHYDVLGDRTFSKGGHYGEKPIKVRSAR